MKIPQKSIPNQPNIGEIFGDLWATWNIDLTSNLGKIRLSKKPEVLISSDNDATLLCPTAFIRNLATSADTVFAVCNQAIFEAPVSTYTFAKDTSGGPTTALSSLYSDAESFNSNLVVSLGTTDIARLVTGTWTNSWWVGTIGATALATSTPHPLCRGFNNLLLVGNGYVVASVDIADDFDDTRLTFPKEYEVQWIRSSNSIYYIGCNHKYGEQAKVFTWDGQSENFIADYKLGSDVTFAGIIKDEICYTVNGNGQLLAFNGGGFTEVARFPIANVAIDRSKRFDDGVSLVRPMNINKNGMTLINGNINILVSAGIGSTNYTFLENMLSGIWEYTKETGLYHKYGLTKENGTTIVDYGSPVLVQAGAIYPLASNTNSPFLAGATIEKANGSTSFGVINRVQTETYNHMGYFITPQISGNEIEEMWQRIFLMYKTLSTAGYTITIKYRTSTNFRTTFSGTSTWVDTTHFTSTASELSAVSAGDEVEILSGEGSGASLDIININSTLVTVEPAITGASGTLRFRVSNWTELETITDLVSENKQVSVDKNSNWIQFKIVLYGKNLEIDKLNIVSKPQLRAV